MIEPSASGRTSRRLTSDRGSLSLDMISGLWVIVVAVCLVAAACLTLAAAPGLIRDRDAAAAVKQVVAAESAAHSELGAYLDIKKLETGGFLAAPTTRVSVEAGNDGQCFIASAVGNGTARFYATSRLADVQQINRSEIPGIAWCER